ncbi:hypothetical protein TNCV_3057031 [Trichonephila clavipes]|nr:hypothetical protein TNCV_3057031 [Trichonephila clavipes]
MQDFVPDKPRCVCCSTHLNVLKSVQSFQGVTAQMGDAYRMKGRGMALYNRTLRLNTSLLLGEIKRFGVLPIPAAVWGRVDTNVDMWEVSDAPLSRKEETCAFRCLYLDFPIVKPGLEK